MDKVFRHDDEKKISDSFEKSFLSRSLEHQIALCENNDYSPIFKEYLPRNQPILEAGCGSGRWVAWFTRNKWKAVGIDWSEKLIDRARKEIPQAEFFTANICHTHFDDNIFGSIISLGAIEHTIQGPLESLSDHNRILRKDGILILSVPYGSPLRKLVYPVNRIITRIKGNNILRRFIGKKPVHGKKYSVVKKETNKNWFPLISIVNGEWQFYEYRFSKSQLIRFLDNTKFRVDKIMYLFPEQGLLHTFGKLVGTFDYSAGQVRFNFLGKLLSAIIPRAAAAHHICFIASKK